jgi:hypothetical protein
MQILCRDGVVTEINQLRGIACDLCTSVARDWRCLRRSGALANAAVQGRKPPGDALRA